MNINILEIDGKTAFLTVCYQISTENEGETSYYNVTDFYRLSYSTDTVTFVQSFERKVGQIFDTDQQVITSNGVTLGITDSDVQYVTEDTGSMTAFVQEGSVFWYSKSGNILSEVFSYTEADKQDIRNTNQDYKIKLIDMDKNGNTKFIVYGYMNRGSHEGETGILVYYFDADKNSVEEKVFIPSRKSADVVADETEQLAYINQENMFYLYADQSIWCINLGSRNNEALCEQIQKDQFVVSEDHRYLAWQDSDHVYDATALNWLDLENNKEQTFTVGQSERIRPLGFVNEDVVYGIASAADVTVGIAGNVMFPMYNLKVYQPNGTLAKERQQSDGTYVTEIEIQDDMIRLLRVKRDGDRFTETSADSLTSNVESTDIRVEASSFTTDVRKREYRLKFETTVKETNPTRKQPSQIAFDINRDLRLAEEQTSSRLYYVYGYGQFQGSYLNAGKAVAAAGEVRGVVVSGNGTVIWRRGGTDVSEINDIEPYKAEEGLSAMGACLQSILALENKKADVQQQLDAGKTAAEILEETLGLPAVLLTDIVMDEDGQNQALQMISNGSPVIAMKDAETPVLIIGYDSINITVMDPEAGEIRKMGRNDSRELFGNAGNIYVTYER